MREISFKQIKTEIKKSLKEACCSLNSFTLYKIKEAYKKENAHLAKETLKQIFDNATIADKEQLPMCQDTGIVTCFVEIGNDVHINCDLTKAINAGVKEAYEEYYFRKSVADPLTRINTKDNTPAIIHTKLVKGDKLKITVVPKGAGSENMSKLMMLNPTDGEDGIVNFVVNTVKEAGGRCCPPIFLGVGIGGNFETAPLLAKEALLRKKGSKDVNINRVEARIKEEVNKLGIGPMGLGGSDTCLDCFINTYPCHIASLPVAVNIQCHASRHVEIIL